MATGRKRLDTDSPPIVGFYRHALGKFYQTSNIIYLRSDLIDVVSTMLDIWSNLIDLAIFIGPVLSGKKAFGAR